MLGYRAYFDVPNNDLVVGAALGELQSWLRWKKYDADALRANQIVRIAEDADAMLLDLDDGLGRSLRAQIVERKPEGAWTSELSVHVPADTSAPASVLVDIRGPGGDGPRPTFASTPRLARGLLTTLDASDSTVRLTDQPQIAGASDVPLLVSAITDTDRRGLLFVAGTDDTMPLEPWRRLVATLLNQTSGLAASYVLDAEATRALSQRLGPSHEVKPGTVRTFHPGAEPGNDLDARRHQILSTARIVNDRSHWLAGILGTRARERALEAQLPNHIESTLRQFNARADELLVAGLVPQQVATPSTIEVEPPELATEAPVVFAEPIIQPSAEAQQAASLLESDRGFLAAAAAMQEVLGISDPTPEDWVRLAQLAHTGRSAERAQADVAAKLDELRTEIDEGAADRRSLLRRVEDEQLEHAATFDALTEAEDELARLRAMLVKTELAAEVWAAPSPEKDDVPDSFVELMNRLDDLPGLRFTGDAEIAVELAVQDPLGLWAVKTWKILLALSDYATASREGRCDRDVHGYLLDLPANCRGYSANKHAPTESDSVQASPKFRRAREFPVPAEVDEGGVVAMLAHFKIAQAGMISPRLHYFDDVRGTGMVYVGYIGPHLPTKQTN